MPRLVLSQSDPPEQVPAKGSLPYPYDASLTDRTGTVLIERVPCGLWHTGEHTTGAGSIFDAQGLVPLDFWEDVKLPNRQLVIEGVAYVIVAATRYDFLPHIDLRLRSV